MNKIFNIEVSIHVFIKLKYNNLENIFLDYIIITKNINIL